MTKEQEEFAQLLKRVKAEFSNMGDEELAELIGVNSKQGDSNEHGTRD